MSIQNLIILAISSTFFVTCTKVNNMSEEIEIKRNQSTYIFSKDDEEKVEINFDDSGNLFSVVTKQEESYQVLFFHQKNGSLKSKTILRPDGNIANWEYFFYEESGILKSSYEYRDTMPYQGVQFYDSTGREKAFLFFDENGEIDEKTEISEDGETIISYGEDTIRHSIVRVE